MSDNFFIVVPTDPRYVPGVEAQQAVVILARQLAPESDEISTDVSEQIRFFDAGANFERATCPRCETALDLEWWQQQMDEDFDGQGFRLAPVVLPCCGATATLNEINYHWPQAFGRFSCTMRNPRSFKPSDTDVAALESAMGGPISLVQSHL